MSGSVCAIPDDHVAASINLQVQSVCLHFDTVRVAATGHIQVRAFHRDRVGRSHRTVCLNLNTTAPVTVRIRGQFDIGPRAGRGQRRADNYVARSVEIDGSW